LALPLLDASISLCSSPQGGRDNFMPKESAEINRILYIEDDNGLARLVQKRLARLNGNIKVDIAQDGRQGLLALDKQRYTVLLVDYNLPGMNGLQILQHLTEHKIDTPVIILTGAGDQQLAVESMKLGAFDYVVKDTALSYISTLPPLIDRAIVRSRLLGERRQAEERVRKLSQAIEQAGEAIMIMDRDGTVEYVNPAYSAISGFTSDETLGNIPPLIKKELQQEDTSGLRAALNEGRTWRDKVSINRKDGASVPVLLSVGPVCAASGDITNFITILQDVSRQEQLESRLRHREKMEALKTLMGGVAHEFNNSLAAMLGSLYMLRRKTSHNTEVSEALEQIERLGYGAANHMKELLGYVYAEVGEMIPLSLSLFIKATIKQARTSDPGDIPIRREIASDRLQISGNPDELYQAFVCLLKNSYEALEQSQNPVIRVKLESFSADDNFLQSRPDLRSNHLALLTITDNGCGMDAACLRQALVPYFTTKPEGQGHGLGLAMVQRTMESHGGIIETDSIPGSGTTVRLYFPLTG